MAALSDRRSFGLTCGRSGDRVTVFQVKLTDQTLRALHSLRDTNTGGPSVQPTIQFKGLQGIIKVPRSSSSDTQSFDFYLSNVTKDNPQGSFECLQQSGSGARSLSVLAPVQNKLTVCATNESHQLTKATQGTEGTKEQGPRVSKPGGPSRVKQVAARKPCPSGVSADVVPERKRSTPLNPANTLKKKCLTSSSSSPVSQRPLRDRVLHLLALRTYKKLELLARLQRDGLSQKDRARLASTLQQVAVLNLKENSFSLRESRFREVQRDWPGFTEEERSAVQRIVTRKLGLSSDASSSSPKDSAPCPSPQKRPASNGDFIDPLAPKRPRISHLHHRNSSSASPEEHHNHRNSSSASPEEHHNHRNSSSASPEEHRSHRPYSVPSSSAPSHSPCTPEGCGTQDLPQNQSSSCQDLHPSPSLNPSPQSETLIRGPSPSGVCRKAKKKSKKHKEKDRERGGNSRAPPGGEDGKRRRDGQTTVHRRTDSSKRHVSDSSELDIPDYLHKYRPLVSAEQRQRYKDDFNSEYDEYRSLHARVDSISRSFRQLQQRSRSLTPGSAEHRSVQQEVLQEYKRIKQSCPQFQEQKRRCEYLHNKLAHIKRLISDYDHQRAQRWS